MQQSIPILSYGILALNIVIFVADLAMSGSLTTFGIKDNTSIIAGQWWRLITPIFLHGGPGHLAVNSYSLYIVGPQVERQFGPWRFALIYMLSGIAGVIASFILTPALSLGASGALFGLIGALLPFSYRNRTVFAGTRARIMSLLQVIGVNLLIGLLPGIDMWAHIGGLIGGLSLGWFATPLYKAQMEFDGSIRVKDESSPSSAWGAAFVLALALGAILIFRVSVFPADF